MKLTKQIVAQRKPTLMHTIDAGFRDRTPIIGWHCPDVGDILLVSEKGLVHGWLDSECDCVDEIIHAIENNAMLDNEPYDDYDYDRYY